MSVETKPFDHVLALNNHLAALAAVGVPVALGNGRSGEDCAATLEKINATIALRMSRGLSLDEALAGDDDLPAIYRHALQAGLRGEHFTPVLEGVNRQARAGAQFQSMLGQALVHPLIVFSLAYFGFIYLCLVVGPTIGGMYTQMGHPPSDSASLLLVGREWMPYWVPLVPLAIVLGAVFWWNRGDSRSATINRWKWLPGARNYLAATKHAAFAEQLAHLTRMGVPLPEALRTASPITGDPALVDAATVIADARERGETLSADHPELGPLPPMLRWSLIGELGEEPLPEVLQFVAENYYETAESRASVLRVVVPAVLGALLGGTVVFLYALSLFLPLIQLLIDTSLSPVG